MKKKVVAGMLAVLMTASLAACGGKSTTSSTKSSDKKSSGEEITLTVWGPQEDQSDDCKWLSEECDAFAKAHPEWNLKFKYGVCSEGDAGKNVTEDATKAADVYMFANDQIPTLVSANAISKLGGDTVKTIKAENSESVVNSVTYNGDIYGVPFTGNTWFMYYNKSVFSEDDVKSLDTMLTKGKVAFPISNGWYLGSLYAANGCTFFGEDGQNEDAGIDLSGDKATQVTNALVDIAANPNFEDGGVDGYDATGKMKSGDIAAFFSGTWDYQNVVEAIGEQNVGVAVAPTYKVNGQDVQIKAFNGTKDIGVNPNCKHQEQAVALALFLGSKDAQEAHYKERNIIPTNSEIDVSSDAVAVAQSQTMDKTSILQPVFSEMAWWWDPAAAFGKALTATDNTKITHDNAAEMTETLNKQINEEPAS